MPKVSYNSPTEEVQNQMRTMLVCALHAVPDEETVKFLLHDLLTPTEFTMLAKRLMAAVLLQRGYAYSAVCATLKLSKATVNTIQKDLAKSGKGYKRIYVMYFQKGKTKSGVSMPFLKWFDALRLPVKGSRKDMQRWRRALQGL